MRRDRHRQTARGGDRHLSDSSAPRIVLTNDDGVDAPGLAALSRITSDPHVIVAPDRHLSGCSHAVTTWQGEIRVDRQSEHTYAVEGTPADCVRLALSELAPQADCVIAGINPGGNLGVDLYYSGTVAAAREAAFHGHLGIAVSHYLKRHLELDWDRAADYAQRALAAVLERDRPNRAFWNINLPHLTDNDPDPEIVFCDPCRQPLPLRYAADEDHFRYEGDYQSRPADEGTDVDLCFGGAITVSLVPL